MLLEENDYRFFGHVITCNELQQNELLKKVTNWVYIKLLTNKTIKVALTKFYCSSKCFVTTKSVITGNEKHYQNKIFAHP